jgi:allantoin racemase
MARILYVSVAATDVWAETLERVLSPWCAADTELVIDHLDDLPEELLSGNLPPAYQYMNQLVARCLRAQEEGYHAVVIGCSGDPGLREVKSLLDIPVVAPMTANLHIATLMKHSVAVLLSAPTGNTPHGWERGIARSAGLDRDVTSWRLVPTPRMSQEDQRRMAARDPKKLAEQILELYRDPIKNGDALRVARRAVEEDGAEAVYFACTLWSGMLDPIREALGVPVLDAAHGALRVAEMLGVIYEQTHSTHRSTVLARA